MIDDHPDHVPPAGEPVDRPAELTGPGRRGVLLAALGAGVAGLGLAGGGAALVSRQQRRRWSDLTLHGAGVGIEPDGSRVLIPVKGAGAVAPGSRVLTGSGSSAGSAAARAQFAAEQDWLLAGTVPGPARWSGMAVDALLDLRALLLDGGALVAAWSAPWRYVWPRDAAFAAAALAAAGHPQDALDILGFLQRVQHPNGLFEARYRPDGSGPPDDRGVQRDGSGWALWGVRTTISALPPEQQFAALDQVGELIDRSASAVVAMTRTTSGLPPPSRDYWELAESRTTLGTAAPVLAGLHAAGGIYRQLGRPELAAGTEQAELRLRASIRRRFGPRYPRYSRGRDLDAAVTFLGPPIGVAAGQQAVLPGVAAARRRTERVLGRPAGGLSPGEGWRPDGASWTPETALFALAAAGAGETARAAGWLDWLAAHRTSIGSLPEKVMADGAPAGPAPLAWTASLALLTLHELDRRAPSAPAAG